MTKRNLFLASLFVSGCLWGSLLTTDAEVILEGPGDGAFGFAVSAVHGDWDTTPDVAVGAPMQDSVFVFTDVATGTTASSSAAVFEGDSGGEAGWALDSGHLVGTGTSHLLYDLMIGAPGEAGGKGVVYILEGGQLSAGDTVGPADAWVSFTGEAAYDYAGWDVASGYLNDDYYEDIVIGACTAGTGGAIYVVYGPWDEGDAIDLADADAIIEGEQAGGSLGCALATGDSNADGRDEIVVGAFQESKGNKGGNGSVYVIYEWGNTRQRISDLSSTSVRYWGATATDGLGYSVDAGQDVDGDGVEDVIMGAPARYCAFYEDHPSYAGGGGCGSTMLPGHAYVVLGEAASGSTITLAGGNIKNHNDLELTSASTGQRFGQAVAFTGDHNGDGISDLAVGSPGLDATFLWYGRSTLGSNAFESAWSDEANAIVDGSDEGMYSGWSVAGLGDLNGDGEAELGIGAPNWEWYVDGPSEDPGAVYVFAGTEVTSAP